MHFDRAEEFEGAFSIHLEIAQKLSVGIDPFTSLHVKRSPDELGQPLERRKSRHFHLKLGADRKTILAYASAARSSRLRSRIFW
jgi:hypothetical protein